MGQASIAAGFAALVVFTASAFGNGGAAPPPESRADRAQDQMALALIHHELGEKNEARDALEAALMADPTYVPALILMEEYRHRGPQAK